MEPVDYAFMLWLQIQPVVVQQSVSWMTVTLALVTGFPACVAAIGGVMALLQSRHNAVVAAGIEKKVGDVSEKAAEIHTLTNSNLSRVTSQLEVANTKLEGFAEQQRTSGAEIKALQGLVNTLVERERGVERVVKETNGILSQQTDPLPVVDDKVVSKLDEIITPKLDKLQDTIEKA